MKSDQDSNSTQVNKQIYRLFFRNLKKLPIFFDPEYLDIVCKSGNWDVILEKDNTDDIVGFLVYFTVKKYGKPAIIMPPLVPFSGIWLLPSKATKVETIYKSELSIIKKLEAAIPKDLAFYTQSHFYNFQNWLPFYWKGYTQTTRYSFRLEDLSKWNLSNVATNIRNKITKAQKTLSAKRIDNPDIVYEQVLSILTQKGIHLTLSKEMFLQLDNLLSSRSKRFILAAIDLQNQIHAVTYIIEDEGISYMMMIGSDVRFRQSGAIPFLIYHSIWETSKKNNVFDFEGSMLESLFDLFAGFGGTLKPYYRIYKAKNIFWDIAYRIKSYYDTSNR